MESVNDFEPFFTVSKTQIYDYCSLMDFSIIFCASQIILTLLRSLYSLVIVELHSPWECRVEILDRTEMAVFFEKIDPTVAWCECAYWTHLRQYKVYWKNSRLNRNGSIDLNIRILLLSIHMLLKRNQSTVKVYDICCSLRDFLAGLYGWFGMVFYQYRIWKVSTWHHYIGVVGRLYKGLEHAAWNALLNINKIYLFSTLFFFNQNNCSQIFFKIIDWIYVYVW